MRLDSGCMGYINLDGEIRRWYDDGYHLGEKSFGINWNQIVNGKLIEIREYWAILMRILFDYW